MAAGAMRRDRLSRRSARGAKCSDDIERRGSMTVRNLADALQTAGYRRMNLGLERAAD
jgi:hypothetical protein